MNMEEIKNMFKFYKIRFNKNIKINLTRKIIYLLFIKLVNCIYKNDKSNRKYIFNL